ncbi:hypothetical protein ABG067_004809 [Albugo candida]
MPHSDQPLRIVTVGDGNFSFSLAYFKYLKLQHDSFRLIASSYDSFHELVTKYPEVSSICAKLKQLGAIVLHRVNAISLKESIQDAISSDGCYCDEVTKTGSLFPLDIIIFHHPHLGHENRKQHLRLLSHFFDSCREILRPECGEIHVTLTLNQLEQWKVQERAKWAGFYLQYCGLFSDYYRVQYDRKRHQNGKSFENVLMFGQQIQQPSILCIWTAAHSDETSCSIEEFIAKYNKDEEKEKVTHLPKFQCKDCGKSFRTAQGNETHFHMVHVLGVSQSDSHRVECILCSRTFKCQDALNEHNVAKHGKNPLVLPDWMYEEKHSSIQSQQKGAAKDWKCSICREDFPSREQLDRHLKELIPTEGQVQVCDLCHAEFKQVRALRQHENHCRAKSIRSK